VEETKIRMIVHVRVHLEGWSHDQLPKMVKNESRSPAIYLPESVGILFLSAPVVEI